MRAQSGDREPGRARAGTRAATAPDAPLPLTPGPGAAAASPVLEVFLDGAPQIAADARFARHVRPDGAVVWEKVLAESGWSAGQRVLIGLAAALCGSGDVPPGTLGAHLTGRQTDLVLAMCRAARRPGRGAAQG
jgi:hypothetical protein